MKNRIIQICELGQPKSIINREDEPISELIKTTDLVEELNEQLTIPHIVARLLKHYNCDTLQIEVDKETKGITVTKCILSEDYYADYDYEHLEELMP
jgi:hypothetical protein